MKSPDAKPRPPEITLPEMLAVEMPRGAAEIGPENPALHALLTGAHCDAGKLSTDLRRKVGPGTVKVTWSCLEAGKAADLIAVAQDPRADLHEMGKVIYVMKAGKTIRNDSPH